MPDQTWGSGETIGEAPAAPHFATITRHSVHHIHANPYGSRTRFRFHHDAPESRHDRAQGTSWLGLLHLTRKSGDRLGEEPLLRELPDEANQWKSLRRTVSTNFWKKLFTIDHSCRVRVCGCAAASSIDKPWSFGFQSVGFRK
jgi:hypothetical protein